MRGRNRNTAARGSLFRWLLWSKNRPFPVKLASKWPPHPINNLCVTLAEMVTHNCLEICCKQSLEKKLRVSPAFINFCRHLVAELHYRIKSLKNSTLIIASNWIFLCLYFFCPKPTHDLFTSSEGRFLSRK